MGKIQRLFNFKPRTRIKSDDVNAELNLLISAHNAHDDRLLSTEGEISGLSNSLPGSSGAEKIGSAFLSQLSGTTVYQQLNSANTQLSNLAVHNHDNRYHTKEEISAYMRTGDTIIKYEVFTIISSNNGDGTFTYRDAAGQTHQGTLTLEGYQRFELFSGNYVIGENRIEAIVNDTLHRSQKSGGLIESSTTSIVLTVPEGNGAEITFKYFERLGLTGEHAITHQNGGADEINGLLNISSQEPVNKKAGKLWGKVLL